MKKEILEEFLKKVAKIRASIKESGNWFEQYNENYSTSKEKQEIDKYTKTFSKLEGTLEREQQAKLQIGSEEFLEKSEKIESLLQPKEELISKVQSQNVMTDLFGKLLDVEAAYQLDGNESKALKRINKINNTMFVSTIDNVPAMQDLNTAISSYSSMFSADLTSEIAGMLDGNYQKRFISPQSELLYSNTKHECQVLNSEVQDHIAELDSYEEKGQKLEEKVELATQEMDNLGGDKYSPSVIDSLDSYVNLLGQQEEHNIEMSKKEKELVERMDKMQSEVDESVDKVVVLESEENLEKLSEQIKKLDLLAAGISDDTVVESFYNFIVTQLNQIEMDLTSTNNQEKGRILGIVAELRMENDEVMHRYNELKVPLELRKKRDEEN